MMITPNSKVKKSVSKPSLIKVFNRHKNKNINISEVSLLVE